MAYMNFKITSESETQTKTIVKARNFEMIIDEPENLGGNDDGATPVEFLLASLAGCLNVVGHLAAKEMGFEIKKMKINIDGDLNPAKFLGKPSKDRTGYVKINVSFELETTADKNTLNEWLKIVESRCPVSDNLSNHTPIEFNISTF